MNRYGALLPALLCLAACGARSPNGLPSVGTIERDRIELTAESNEPILEILVGEGDAVVPGQVLVRQDTARGQAQLARAQAERDVARARLREATAGPRGQEIERGRAQLAAAKSAAATVKYELDRELALVEKQHTSRNRVDILQGQYEEAVARREEVTAALDELLEGTRSEELDRAQSELAAAEASVAELEIGIRRATIESPAAGVVEALPYEVGERPPAEGVLAVVLAAQPTYARVHVPEPLRTRLMPGMRAEIRVDGHATPFEGRLRWIASDAAFTPYYALTQYDRGRLSYLAEVDVVDAQAAGLPAGVPA